MGQLYVGATPVLDFIEGSYSEARSGNVGGFELGSAILLET